jgi:monovalent cation:H+ antiporter-2, CPA2 family
MHFESLQSLVIIFAVSALAVFILNRINIPSIAGFLIAGILIGPHASGWISNVEEIEFFAEVGVILLLFTLGMEFSLKKLLKMKRIVFGSGLIQVTLTISVTFLIALAIFDLPVQNAIFWGFLIALSSTAIIVKSISDNNENATPQGRAMIGIVLFQDLSVVLFIILIPLMGGNVEFSLKELFSILIKATTVIVFVIAGSKWLVPFLFDQIVKTKSRELFIITIMLFCLGTAMFTNMMGLSLSLGAFLAGMMLSESDYAYQAMADVVPFKESFLGLFFVSVGMLLNISVAYEHLTAIIILFSALIIIKSLIGFLAVKMAGFTSRTSIIAGMGLAQIGEFSFVLAIEGRLFGLISEDLYQIFIATTILSMLATPFLFKIAVPVSTWLVKHFKRGYFGNHKPELYTKDFLSRGSKKDHVMITGFDFNGRNLAGVLKQSGIPYVVIDTDMSQVKYYKRKGEPIYYGDATSADILNHLGIKQAKMLVCTVSDPINQRKIISNARQLNKCLYILTRTRHVKSVEDLKRTGANDVIPEEFETSLEIFHRVFLYYNVAPETIEKTLEDIRQNNYSLLRGATEDKISLLGQLQCIPEVDIRSFKVNTKSFMIGKTVRNMNLRQETGVTVLAIRRENELITTPNLETPIRENDILLFTGDTESIGKAISFFQPEKQH